MGANKRKEEKRRKGGGIHSTKLLTGELRLEGRDDEEVDAVPRIQIHRYEDNIST